MRKLVFVALALLSCTYPQEQQQKQQQDEKKQKDEGEPAAPASPMGGMALLSSIFEQAKGPGPWDEPETSPGFDDGQEHALVLGLSGAIVELETPFSLFGKAGGAGLRQVVRRLHDLAGREHVASILLRIDDLDLSLAVAEELRAAVAAVKKPVDCHVEAAGDHTMLVLSACRSIAIAPGGTLLVAGPSLTPLYLRGLLDKLSIQPDFLHIGAYKGAAEPLLRKEPSPEMRQTLDAVLDGAYQRLVSLLASGRKVPAEKAAAWVDQALFEAADARQAGLVDEVAPFEAWRDGKAKAWKRVEFEDKKDDLGGLLAMLGKPKQRPAQPHVALLYAVGTVVDGKGTGGKVGARSEIAPRRLVPAIRAAAAAESVKAIVLRVDSPGGSALASELIRTALDEAKAKKPVIVSMANLAASGGYWISCGATKIYAQADTLTGSIGVVGGKLALGPALASIGVNVHSLGRGKRSAILSPVRKWTDDERQVIEALMRKVYDQFKARVAAGRGLTPEKVEAVAQGRLWIGADAKSRGLVDEIGGLDDALAAARKLAGLPDDAPVDVYPGEPTLTDVLESLGTVSAPSPLAALGLVDPALARRVENALALLAGFADEPVRVVTFVGM